MIAKISIVVAAIVLAVTLAFGCAPVEREEVQVVRITGHMPIGQYCTTACERMIEEAEELSNGTLKFVHFPAGQLVKDMPAFEMCQAGGIEMAQLFCHRAVGVIAEGDLILPYFDNPDIFARRMYDPATGGIFYTLLRPKFAEQGLHLMPGVLYGVEVSTVTIVPVHCMADYEGLKLRTYGVAAGSTLDSWGATAVVMSSADVYMAIQRGTIDGANSGLTSIRSRKWFEVADYVQMIWQGATTIEMIANLDWWNSLTPFHQECIEEASRHACIWSFETAIAEVEGDKKFLEDKGLEVIDFPATYPDEYEKMVAVALPAIEEKIGPMVGEAVWNEAMAALDAARVGTKTWREILETMEW